MTSVFEHVTINSCNIPEREMFLTQGLHSTVCYKKGQFSSDWVACISASTWVSMKWVDFSSVFSAMLKVDWLETLSLADIQKKVITAS